ncbi:RsmE family RNA methyltransferase [Frigoriflavimonas asaccharolytica]|uniref:Ribosomal RNA small subunit methyltransferase E n=1 Tax=Frigoriflavimonas asaccharolytica TaxID=2735899 RepID=A0A8J8GDL3_9FLAO|nr:RsmE family RNA methyltransferase [Frigoriflavimonas asaccharolytica]NRS94000.1 16S rRNA (uracil1498-N3)-methyltransferase [Frigoriflavimonas asaccharolytica]
MKLFFGEIFPEIKIDEPEQQHMLKVLRLKNSDEIYLTDGKGNAVKGNLIIEGKKISLDNIENLPFENKNPQALHIAIAPTKNIDRIEFFLEKAIEMGVDEISFIQTDHSERKNINFEKLQKQALAASKQSLRFQFPVLNDLQKLSDFLNNNDLQNCVVAHCNENLTRQNLSEISKENLTFLIGPEGDFSDREIQLLQDKKIPAVSLGERRLRTETAGIFAAAWHYLSYP